MTEIRPFTPLKTPEGSQKVRQPRKNAPGAVREKSTQPRDMAQILEAKRAKFQRPALPRPETAPQVPLSVPEYKEVKPLQLMKVDELRKAYPRLTGKGVGVAVIDSGFNYPGEEPQAWKDFLDNSEKPVDPLGHGTLVAGDVKKAAPEADLIALRASDENGIPSPRAVLNALQWSLENKDRYNLKVVNLSLGVMKNPLYPYKLIDEAASRLAEAGVLVVCAAGNEGPEPGSLCTVPNDNPQVLTVGGADTPLRLTETSSRGPAESGAAKPDITAPGAFIKSWAAPDSVMLKDALEGERIRAMSREETLAFMKSAENMVKLGVKRDTLIALEEQERILTVKNAAPKLFMAPDGRMAPFEGTSFAAPLVSGIAALLAQGKPEATPQELKEVLKSTAKPMPGYSPDDQGAGFVDAKAAADKLLAPQKKERHA